VLFLSVLLPCAQAAPRKIIIDTDPGTDDAMAIMLALNSPELDVRAITVVPGNVIAKQGLDNALRMLSLANRCDIPLAAGAQHPLFQKLITAEFWHGKNGLANIELPPSKSRSTLAGPPTSSLNCCTPPRTKSLSFPSARSRTSLSPSRKILPSCPSPKS
jgi:hypothetical protein